MPASRKRLGEILVERSTIDRHQLKAALARQKKWGKKIGETLVDMGFLTEKKLAYALSDYLRVPVLDLERFPVEMNALRLVSPRFCADHTLLPIALRQIKGKERLVIVTADPSNLAVLDELKFVTGVPIALAISTLSSIRNAIKKYCTGQELPRDEITITTTVRPEDAQMEVIRQGEEEIVYFGEEDNVGVRSRPPADTPTMEDRWITLVGMLVDRQVLDTEDAARLLHGIKVGKRS